MNRLKEIFVVHHTHTDWGYTTNQSLIEEIHHRFIDQAVELCLRNDDKGENMRFRWTCECSWLVHSYLAKRAEKKRREFLKCVERGDIEVTAMPLQPTPLADDKTIRAALSVVHDLRKEGIPVSSAMVSDVNGLSLPWADALLDAGITNIDFGMNFTCGGGMKRWTPFRWKSASGRTLLCWQGTHYNQGAYWKLNHDLGSFAEAVPARLDDLKDYPYDKLLVQATNKMSDNQGPHPRYLEYLRDYNALAKSEGWPLMRPVCLKQWFGFLEKNTEAYPVYSGDMTDWWACGVGSTPMETAALMEAQRRIGVAEKLGGESVAMADVRKKIFLASEHTWGSAASVNDPWGLAAKAGLAAKQNMIYEAAYAANEALRKSIAPKHIMSDPRFESFDPAWVDVMGDDPSEQTVRGFCPKAVKGADAAWSAILKSEEPDVMLEVPADGLRSTWFERGKIAGPEKHGRWPSSARWIRSSLKGAKTECRNEGDVLRWDVSFELDVTSDPRSVYIIFPFRMKDVESVLADVGGAWADPRDENVPGTCKNWWTVHNGILLRGKFGSVLWTAWDAPMVMFDEPCPNPPKEKNLLNPPVLVSWALNTYWFTNFAGISGGKYTFRYRAKYWDRPVSLDEVRAFCESDPLSMYPRTALSK